MIKNKLLALISVVAIVLLSSGKKEVTETNYSAKINALAGMVEVNGGEFIPDSLKGKMLIVNVWASYDANSRINSYELVELANRYSNSNFFAGEGLEVVSISLDTYRSPLKKAIATDGTDNFHHLCDYKGADSEIAKSFGVSAPINMLIDADGRVLARDFNVKCIADALAFMASAN